MKRLLLATGVAVASLLIGAGFIWIRTGQAKRVKFNVKDIPEHGITILSPAAPSFDNETMKLKAGKTKRAQSKIDALKPFSAFIVNSGKDDVIAYTVKWELTRADGRVITSFDSYSAPAVLMGEKVPTGAESDQYHGKKIKRNSKRISSWNSSIDEEDGPSASYGNSTDPDPSIATRVIEALQNGEDTVLTDAITKQLADATDITMTLDSAVFADGTFVGPDTAGVFPRLRAQIKAKHDLLRAIQLAFKSHKTPEQILNHFEQVSKVPQANEERLISDGTSIHYYRYFSTIYRTELLKMRTSIGDDKQTLAYALQPTHRPWRHLEKAR